MSAEIIQFGGPGVARKMTAVVDKPIAPRRGRVVFQFKGQEYEASFIDSDLYWIRKTAYRIQNGKRVRCSATTRKSDPSPQLVAAARAALAKPAGETRHMGEVDAATLRAVKLVERIKRISTSIGQHIKAGDVPGDLMMELGEWAHTALDALPPLESKFV